MIRNQAATRSGGFYEFKPMYVSQLSIPGASDTQKAAIASLVQQILAIANPPASPFAKGGEEGDFLSSPDVARLEGQIDRLVYDLYGLSADEIELVEKNG